MTDNDFIIDNGILLEYTGTSEEIIIPHGIYRIEDYSFKSNDKIKSVIINDDSVREIGIYAFAYCTKLESIRLGNRISVISPYTFESCLSLETIIIPDSVWSIEQSAFGSCKKLKSVTIGNGVKKIGMNAFFECNSLLDLTIPENVTSINYSAFNCCDNLVLHIPFNFDTGAGYLKHCKDYVKYHSDNHTSVF